MHRIAGTFIGGAGLLTLIPIFFKDAIPQILIRIVTAPTWREQLLIAPALVSLILPLYALGVLLRDLVHFYFSAHTPDWVHSGWKFHPRFALTAITLSTDEAPTMKLEVIKTQEESDSLKNFLLPAAHEQQEYFQDLLKSNINIIPRPDWRKPENNMIEMGVVFGLTDAVDRTLVAEVAKMEVSLVRHGFALRRLVLRYTKALLVSISTASVSFLMSAVLANLAATSGVATASHDKKVWLIAAVVYFLWALVTPRIVHKPIKWIHQHADQNANTKDVNRDRELVQFERVVRLGVWGSGLVAFVSMLLIISHP